MPVTLPVLLIYLLAAARVTGMIVEDDLFDAPRAAVLNWLDPAPGSLGSYVSRLITCQWCTGFWVASTALLVMVFAGDSPWMLYPAMALAGSQVIGMISTIGR